MRTLKPWLILGMLALLIGGAWAGFRSLNAAISEAARQRIIDELAREGLRAEIGRLTLDPFGGLLVQKVRLYGGLRQEDLLASFNGLKLDVDIARFLHNEQFINTIELDQAHLSLPLDPGDPKSSSLRFIGIDANVVASGDKIEIREARADFYGIDVRVSGSILRPRDKMRRLTWERVLDFLRSHREFTARLLRELHRLHYDGAAPPTLSLQVQGDLDHPESLRLSASFHGENIRYGIYRAHLAHIEADWFRGGLQCRNVRLRDRAGELLGEARWQRDSPEVHFQLVSTADLPSLARALQQWPELREVVFYWPSRYIVQAEGKYRIDHSGEGLPLQATGHLECGRFNTRGIVFDGVQGDFFVDGRDFHVRDFRLDHHSGSVSGRVLRQDGAWRYHAHLRMDPSVLSPFLPDGAPRGWLERFRLGDGAAFAADVRGEGTEGQTQSWKHAGEVRAGHLRYGDYQVRNLEAALRHEQGRTVASQIRLQRPEGRLQIQQVVHDLTASTLQIEGLSGEIDPVPVLELFKPAIARRVEGYGLRRTPAVTFSGTIGLGENTHRDYSIQFKGSGPAHYPLGQQRIPLVEPAGSLRVFNELLLLDVQSRVEAGARLHGATLVDASEARLRGQIDLSGSDRETRWTLTVHAPGRIEYSFGGQPLPLMGLEGACEYRRGRLEVDRVTAGLLGGRVTGTAQVDRFATTREYSAALQFDGVSFAGLAALYSPETRTGGVLSGGLRFHGSGRGEQKVRGSGSATVKDGNVFAIPLLGPLSPLVAAVLPGSRASYGQARKAEADFLIHDGIVTVRDFEALTTAFVIKGGGDINYTTRRVNLEARVNTRGPTGILLFPVSKLLEYEALGTTQDPEWRPKVLSLPGKLLRGR